MAPASRPARLVANVLVVLGSGVLALFVLEAGVRIAGMGSDQFLRPDPVLGVRFIPSKRGLSQGTCYRTDVSINRAGWRGPEISDSRAQDAYRVLVLGDSFMAGLQVGDRDTFARVLEERLNGAGLDRRVEVVNFGVPSWGTDQEYLALREYGVALEPDLVLLAFYAQNDVSDNDAEIRSASSTYPKPDFDVVDGRLVEVPFVDATPGLVSLGRRLAAPLRIYPMTRDALLAWPLAHRLLYTLGIVGVVPQSDPSRGPAEDVRQWPDRWRRQLGVFERPAQPRPDWERAWAITEGLLDRMRSEAEGAGAGFLVLGVASPIEVMPASILREVVGSVDRIDLDGPGARLAAVGERRGFDVMSLVPAFRERISDSAEAFEELFLDCDGHWTVQGHRLAAEIAAPAVLGHLEARRP